MGNRMIRLNTASWLAAVAAWLSLAGGIASAAAPLVELRGVDFQGGAKARFGHTFYGRSEVNYVYARATAADKMVATIHLADVPGEPLFLFIEGRDNELAKPCRIKIAVNGRVVREGPSGFPRGEWGARCLAVPPGAWKAGANELAVFNEEPSGSLGMPPWFMVAHCVVAGASYEPPIWRPLAVEIPSQVRPLPEPLTPDHREGGFKFRGAKGYAWTPEQYLEEIPVLAKYRMNFLMNCYLSLFDAGVNEWWKPMTDARKAAYAKVFRASRENGIHFCFAVHPQFRSPRPLKPSSRENVDRLYQHYAWAQSQGVQWFSISLDDVSWGSEGPARGAAEHASLVNTVFGRLRAKNPDAQMIFCPVPYAGDGTARNRASTWRSWRGSCIRTCTSSGPAPKCLIRGLRVKPPRATARLSGIASFSGTTTR